MTINGKEPPRWVIILSYLLGMVFGALLLLRVFFGVAEFPGILIANGIYLILFPILREGAVLK